MATALGIVNLVSHIVAIGAPLVAGMGEPYPVLIFFINVGIGAMSMIFLKEIDHDVYKK